MSGGPVRSAETGEACAVWDVVRAADGGTKGRAVGELHVMVGEIGGAECRDVSNTCEKELLLKTREPEARAEATQRRTESTVHRPRSTVDDA